MAKKKKVTSKKTPRRAAVVPEGAREKLMQVSRALFAERGIDGVSVRDISRETGLNVSLVSYYFGGKEGLYLAILEEHARAIETRIRQTVLPLTSRENLDRKSFGEAMRSVIDSIVDMRSRDPEMSAIIQREKLSGLPFAKKVHDEIFNPLSKEFMDFISRAQEKKVIRADIRGAAYFVCLVEAMNGYFSSQECGMKFPGPTYQLPKEKDQFVDFMTRLFTEGIYK